MLGTTDVGGGGICLNYNDHVVVVVKLQLVTNNLNYILNH